MAALPADTQNVHGTVRCVDGLPGQACMACDVLKAFETTIYFAGVGDANPAAAAKQVIDKIRANPDTPVFVSVQWIDGHGAHARWVEVTKDGARLLDDDALPMQ